MYPITDVENLAAYRQQWESNVVDIPLGELGMPVPNGRHRYLYVCSFLKARKNSTHGRLKLRSPMDAFAATAS